MYFTKGGILAIIKNRDKNKDTSYTHRHDLSLEWLETGT
jgi:hypothetical protein